MGEKMIDPWGSTLVEDYSKIVRDFGLEVFDSELFPEPNRLMRRGVLFAGRDLKVISNCIKDGKPFYVLTGMMPTGDKIHFGTKLVVESLKYFQDNGAITFVLIADLEAAATRGITLEQAKQRAMDFYIPAYLSLGLNPNRTFFYFQSENKDVMNMAYVFAKKITLNEFRAIYGSADPGRIMAAVAQTADMLYPQFKKKMPGIIPVGIDQDPHIRLCRDLIKRTKDMKFQPLASVYNKFTPSLDGDLKMSKSKPESCLELPEDIKIVTKKLNRAKTGGRETAEEQQKLGGEADKCAKFEFDKQHAIEDDIVLDDIYKQCYAGTRLCGACKKITIEQMTNFMNEFNKGCEKAKKDLNKLNFIKFN